MNIACVTVIKQKAKFGLWNGCGVRIKMKCKTAQYLWLERLFGRAVWCEQDEQE